MEQRQRRLSLAGPWLALLGLAALVGITTVEMVRLALEAKYREVISLETLRRADEVTAQTLNGNVMGSVANLGLVNLAVKNAALGALDPNDRLLLDTLEAVGNLYDASGVFIVNQNGVIQASWDKGGKSSNGLDVKFRPYFQIAMKGQRNVYAAVSLTTGQRALYFAAPLFSNVSLSATTLGAAVARLDLKRVDSVLKSWGGHALLLSPQNIVFAADQAPWIGQLAAAATPDQLQAIRSLKQFGAQFDAGAPSVLPFDMTRDEVAFDGHRFGLARSDVHWNDPAGAWTLVLLGDLDELMPPVLVLEIGFGSGAIVMLLGAIFLAWRHRLNRAHASRKAAEADLLLYSQKLEVDSATKSFLVEVSALLHRAQDVTEFARLFFHHTTPRVGADVAGFYVFNESSARLEPVGSHGMLLQDLPAYELGQGLVGQCAKELRPLLLPDSSSSPLRVSWGGGEAVPTSVYLWPIERLGHLLGVVVLGAQTPLGAGQLTFVDELLSMVAMNLEILARNTRTRDLLQESQRQSETLAHSRATTTALLNAIPDVIFFKSPEGVYLGCNEAYSRLIGRPVNEIVGKTDDDLYPREVADYYRSDDVAVLALPQGRALEEWVDFADGRHVLLDTVKSAFWDDQGQLLGLLSIGRDVTQRQQEKEKLDLERAKLQEILDASPLGVGITVNGVARMLNPMIQTLIDAEVGRSISETYVDPTERDRIVAQLKQQRVIRDVEVSMYNRDRQPRTMRVTFMRIDYENDSGVLVWMLDVTGTKTKKGATRGKS